jgi:hypothetical protein
MLVAGKLSRRDVSIPCWEEGAMVEVKPRQVWDVRGGAKNYPPRRNVNWQIT